MSDQILQSGFVSAHDFLQQMVNETPGDTEEEKLLAWLQQDQAELSNLALATARRVLIGMQMLKEYGEPAHGEKQKARAAVAAKYGIKLTRAYHYMSAADAVIRATGLHISDGDVDENLILPKRAFDREVQDVQNYVACWMQGVDADEKAAKIAESRTIHLPEPPDPVPPPKKPPSRKAWEKAGEKLLTELPQVEGHVLRAALVAHRDQVDRKLMDLVDHPGLRTPGGLLAEVTALVARAKELPDPKARLATLSQIRDNAHAVWLEAYNLEQKAWNEDRRLENLASIESAVAAKDWNRFLVLSSVAGLHESQQARLKDLAATVKLYGIDLDAAMNPAPAEPPAQDAVDANEDDVDVMGPDAEALNTMLDGL
jgi:hypothetical protein